MRDRCVQPLNFRGGTLWVLYEIAHLPDLFLHIFQGTCSIEFGDTQALFLQQFPRRAFGKAAGDDDIRIQHQHVLGFTRQLREFAGLRRIPGARGIARIRAEPEDLFRIGQRHQQLIGAKIDRGDARKAGGVRTARQPGADHHDTGHHTDRGERTPHPLAL